MAGSVDREALIGEILDKQRSLVRLFAQDRSLPLLASTLTMQQLKVVIILSYRDEIAGHELAAQLGVKLGTATGIVDRLVARDLVFRQEDPHDRRVRRVALTTKGKELVDELADTNMAGFRALLDELDTETLAVFDTIMDRIQDVADKRARS